MKKNALYLVLLAQVLFSALPNSLRAQQTLAEWNFPGSPDNATVDLFVPVNTGATIITQGGTGAAAFANAGATTRSAHCTGWDNGNSIKYWQITISTSGYSGIWLSSKQRSSSTGPRDFKVQYQVGAGLWTDLPGATAITVADNWTSGIVNSIILPAACDNQPAVSIRWIMTSNISVGAGITGAAGVTNIDDINFSWASDHYYRSLISGNWSNISTWESSADNITWNPAVIAPSFLSRTITVQNSHVVTVSSNIKIDETVIVNGGTLLWASSVITISNGAGVDLQVDGTLSDNSPSNVSFLTGAKWALSGAGTMIKTSAGSANNWRDNYNAGIVNIPSTATWIVRKTGVPNPSVSSVQMYYPNLIVENNVGGIWVAFGSSGFQGASTNTVIKGNMDIGGSGSGFVDFENIMTNANPTVVLGSLNIRAGNTLRNYGTGFEIYGNVTCDGSLTYDATDARRLIFSGSGAQSISGTGSMNVYNMVMNKSLNDLTLNRPVKVDYNITFNNPGGRIFSSSANLLIIESAATATNANNTSFVHGPVRKLGTPAFTFPVGKDNDYQAIGMGIGSGGSGGVFWTEDFGSGCNQGQTATAYTGVNGSWNISLTGLNEVTANTFFVSAAENGAGAGNCGAGCGSNRTLHVGSTTPVDPGAAYLETDPFTCSFIGWCSATDKRAESPLIDCSGQTGITLSFNYMEYGEGTNDNATLWYYDGAAWSLLMDLPKTLCCGGVICTGSIQGLWTPFSIALPVSANNNPNVRLGFRWVNNADGVATDPSFAVDDIRLSVAATVESFTAEYFTTNPQADFNNVVNPFIDHISQCEYWILNRDAGSSSRLVTLTWDNNSCGVNSLADLTVARFNGLSWDDRGNGGTTGTFAAGTITSAAAQTDYGPFTLASTTTLNPLPVELLNFDARFKGEIVEINWVTASEINSDYFTLLRSADGINFNAIENYKAAGNSSGNLYYHHIDEDPLPAVSYYQLNQYDFDGTSHLSQIVAVKNPEIKGGFSVITIIPEPSASSLMTTIYSGENRKLHATIFDGVGKLVFSEIIFVSEGVNTISFNGLNLERGLYSLQLSSLDKSYSTRFVF